MCGITGIIDSRAATAVLQASLAQLAHRGPDGQGSYRDAPLQLGHVRLAVQDLSDKAAQPMQSEDGRYVLVYNGEWYNHQSLRQVLEQKGVRFRSTSDTETLLYGFAHFGDGVLQYMNGIFAFAVYDKLSRELFLARDHFGVKPLYYYAGEGRFLFASEIKALLPFGIDREINPDAFYQTLLLQWQPEAHTGFRQVHRLKPGHCISLKLDSPCSFQVTQWYRPSMDGKYHSSGAPGLVAALDQLLQQAVRRQLCSDRPVGYFLSGGLDSSLLAAIARSQDKDSHLPCFTIDTGNAFRREGFSADLSYARQVAGQLDARLHVIEAKPGMLSALDQMIWHLDEPQGDLAPLLLQQIAQAAREQGIPVLIGGTGADDIFSGYRRHQALLLEQQISRVPVVLRKGMKHMLQRLPDGVYTRRWKKLGQGLDLSPEARISRYYFWASPLPALYLFREEYREQIDRAAVEYYFERLNTEIPEEQHLLNRMLYYELRSFLPAHNLNYTDKMAMASGVEVRVPYLDLDLVTWAMALDPSLKMKGTVTKYLLRQVARRYLPAAVIDRPKTGFGVPLRQWIKEDALFREDLAARLFEGTLSHYFDQPAIARLWHDTLTGSYDGSYTLLSLAAIESWIRQFQKG